MIKWIIKKYQDYKINKRLKKKLKDIRKKDPFIYK